MVSWVNAQRDERSEEHRRSVVGCVCEQGLPCSDVARITHVRHLQVFPREFF